ncbi:hypothetical protein DGG96_17360 [Legionella qingyii]|uniref:Uncharacterized protein n=1 Tax=Legionella qingyii TaxID=2184757 RepID=A0A317U0W9_9GAMM|nr:hypothetical protein DGG96_17360 [Legionella qingyii]
MRSGELGLSKQVISFTIIPTCDFGPLVLFLQTTLSNEIEEKVLCIWAWLTNFKKTKGKNYDGGVQTNIKKNSFYSRIKNEEKS